MHNRRKRAALQYKKPKTRKPKVQKKTKWDKNESYLGREQVPEVKIHKNTKRWRQLVRKYFSSCQCPSLPTAISRRKNQYLHVYGLALIGRANEATEIQITKFTSREKKRWKREKKAHAIARGQNKGQNRRRQILELRLVIRRKSFEYWPGGRLGNMCNAWPWTGLEPRTRATFSINCEYFSAAWYAEDKLWGSGSELETNGYLECRLWLMGIACVPITRWVVLRRGTGVGVPWHWLGQVFGLGQLRFGNFLRSQKL